MDPAVVKAGHTDLPRSTIRGTNQSGMREHNERLVLTLLRRHGSLAKAELARMTGLSAQTVSVIMRGLEAEGLIVRGKPQRGRVGQPSIPMRLAADGAFFFGLKVGRRSLELLLVDFLGQVVGQAHETYRYPMPGAVVGFARRAIPALAARLTEPARARIAGLGVGLPFHLWDWAAPLGVPREEMAIWREIDLKTELAAGLDCPVHLENDASAACNAEIVFGGQTGSRGLRDFAYAYIGFFAGGGLVLNGRLVSGRTGNAGALGSMPVPAAGASVQLLDVASLSGLERMLAERGNDGAQMWERADHWALDPDAVAAWIRNAAAGLAHVAASSAALLDLQALVIDGWMPEPLRARLIQETAAALSVIDLSGAARPSVIAGSIGPNARALGAASLPLSMRFLADPSPLGGAG